jgi:hypothetical protein
MTDYPGWATVPAAELGQHKGRIVSVYRSRIPTRIVDVSEPDAAGIRQMGIEWTEPTSAAGGLIRHEAGRRETVRVGPEDEFLVRVDTQAGGAER